MKRYYLDIETTGLDPENSSIITIQYQKINSLTGKAEGELIILKSWESSEEEIIKKFIKIFNEGTQWDFVAHGYNLHFENKFLSVRAKKYGGELELFKNPTVDLHPLGILMNGGNFKGSGLDKISGKNADGLKVLEMCSFEDYDGIEDYIKQETKSYLELYYWLLNKMPLLLEEFKLKLKKN